MFKNGFGGCPRLEAVTVVHALVHNGRIEVQGPIPDSWEGHMVKIVPLTPDEPLPDIERRLAELHALGPMEFDPAEREIMARELEGMNQISLRAMNHVTGTTP